ncbi:GCN5-related N-acetyltransferase [Lentinus tigrinus ALCF2SS1-7]|uniref:GCN5-related N-acetyltransferase n=1 Tax=Lentinus tigrinus ALCF2SS1-6 TaxID=1328759 RepID=A0A5C2S096_9APHY|nr:GCN5-related N-acetyltransferase [Lentinus tigrinus ALCF2SS1-6]RPD71609.1 GCN5-related N-acetyltransferase [Lentinus tigrinus ALCF2SS1-7]
MAGVGIRRISAEDTVPLRHSVLWPNHPVSYVLLPEDDSGFHYGAFFPDATTPVAVISVFVDPLPQSSDSSPSPKIKCARFRKFACDPEHQGKGIGTALLQHAFDAAVREMSCEAIWCDARMSAAGWYERRGMRKFGDVFFKGDIKYVKMKREFVTTEP